MWQSHACEYPAIVKRWSQHHAITDVQEECHDDESHPVYWNSNSPIPRTENSRKSNELLTYQGVPQSYIATHAHTHTHTHKSNCSSRSTLFALFPKLNNCCCEPYRAPKLSKSYTRCQCCQTHVTVTWKKVYQKGARTLYIKLCSTYKSLVTFNVVKFDMSYTDEIQTVM